MLLTRPAQVAGGLALAACMAAVAALLAYGLSDLDLGILSALAASTFLPGLLLAALGLYLKRAWPLVAAAFCWTVFGVLGMMGGVGIFPLMAAAMLLAIARFRFGLTGPARPAALVLAVTALAVGIYFLRGLLASWGHPEYWGPSIADYVMYPSLAALAALGAWPVRAPAPAAAQT